MASQATSRTAVTIGRNIKLARESEGLTQRKLAELIDVGEMLVSKWERGLHRPQDGNLELVAERTNREPAWFYVEHSEVRA